MKRLARVIRVLGAIGGAVLMLAWYERGSFNEEVTQVSCAHFGGGVRVSGDFSGEFHSSVSMSPVGSWRLSGLDIVRVHG